MKKTTKRKVKDIDALINLVSSSLTKTELIWLIKWAHCGTNFHPHTGHMANQLGIAPTHLWRAMRGLIAKNVIRPAGYTYGYNLPIYELSANVLNIIQRDYDGMDIERMSEIQEAEPWEGAQRLLCIK